ncbi:PIN domain-like protein [Mucidula mucida]|nr:PIN domain-like protein [Mucidula mucida]
MPRMSTAPSQLPPSPVNACAGPSTFISRARALHSSRRTRAIVAVVDVVPVAAITNARFSFSRESDRTNSAFESRSTLILRLSALTIMGIPGLYQHVKSTAQVVSLHEMSAIEGFVAQRREKGYIVVGINACLWIQRILHGQNMRHVYKGSNAEVKELLRQLARLLNYTIVPLFVFDGPERPNVKRGKKVVYSPGWLVRIFKELIDAFGFYHHDARGEAEAELAAFNYRKFIDVVITDDSDALIFGTCILGRGLDLKEPFPSLTIYSRNRITEDLGMSPGGLLLFALLVGGDYDKTGLKGCGGATAAGLAKTRLGDDLRDAFHDMMPADFAIFCVGWRNNLAYELMSNVLGALPHCCPNLAQRIPDTFPDYTVVQLYASPPISETLECDLLPCIPDVDMILSLHHRYILPTSAAKYKLLHEDIVPGYFFKMIQLSEHHSESFVRVAKRLHDPNAQNSFVLAQINLRKSQVVRMDAFSCLAMATYRQYSVKVPAIIVRHALPALLEDDGYCAQEYHYILPVLRSSNQPLEIISGEGGPGSSAAPTFPGYNWDDGGSDAGDCNGDGKAENSDIDDSLVIDMEDVEVEIVRVEHVQRPAEVIVISDDEDGGTGGMVEVDGTVEVIDISDDEQDGALAMSGVVEVIDISDDEE